ncbi:MAG: uridine kinase family protein [bacterium]
MWQRSADIFLLTRHNYRIDDMLGDILLINEMHKRAAEEIFAYFKLDFENRGEGYKYILAISGESGSGKSEVSHSLANMIKTLGLRVKILHTDNYYIVPPLLRYEWRKTHGLDSIGVNEYDWKLIGRNLNDFREDRESMLPCIDIVSSQVDKLITDFRKIHVLVVDGLFAIHAEEADMRVFIELTYHETKMTQIIRGKEPNDEYRMQVLEREHRDVQKLKPLADLFIDKNYKTVPGNTDKFKNVLKP